MDRIEEQKCKALVQALDIIYGLDRCPECGEPRPDDDRVKCGMKCRFCAYADVAIPFREN